MKFIEISGWKYYNHAAIPSTAPHFKINLEPILNGNIWRIKGTPLLARWTSDFDCGYETEWWWVIKDSPYSLNELSTTTKKHIRQSQKKCYVKKINFLQEFEAIYKVYESAYKGYQLPDNYLTKEQFYKSTDNMGIYDCWGAYDIEQGNLIGWMTCEVFEDCVKTVTAKYDVDNLRKRASDAIHHAICEYYLNKNRKKYIAAGERNVNHITNSHEYKISTFGFRKAYCHLHVEYRWWVKCAVVMLYPFRNLLKILSKYTAIRKVLVILQTEKIVKTFK